MEVLNSKLSCFIVIVCSWCYMYVVVKASASSTCSSRLNVHTAGQKNSFSLKCVHNRQLFLNSEITISWFFSNGNVTAMPVGNLSTPSYNLTLRRGVGTARNHELMFNLSGNYRRAELEGNYSCGCSLPEINRTAPSGRGNKTVFIEPLPDLSRPDVFAGEIGKPFTLSSQLVFGANSHLLRIEWFRASCTIGTCQQTDSLRSNTRYQLEGTDLRIVNVNKSDGPKWYTQSITRPPENAYFFNFRHMSNRGVYFIPFIPPVISVSSPSLEKHGVIRVLLYNKQLFPSNHRSLKFTLSSYPPVFTTNYTTVDADQSFFSEEFGLNSLIVSLALPSPNGGTFPSTIAVTWSAELNIEQNALNKVQVNPRYSKLQNSIHETTNQTVIFKIFEINDAQLNVSYERLCNDLIRATVHLTNPVPPEFPYSIHFVILNPTDEESIATENGTPETLSQSFILDGKGRVNKGEKMLIHTTLFFQIGDQTVQGPQDTRELNIEPPPATVPIMEVSTTDNTTITAVSISCATLVFVVIVILAAVSVLVVATRQSKYKRLTGEQVSFHYVPGKSESPIGQEGDLSDVASNQGSQKDNDVFYPQSDVTKEHNDGSVCSGKSISIIINCQNRRPHSTHRRRNAQNRHRDQLQSSCSASKQNYLSVPAPNKLRIRQLSTQSASGDQEHCKSDHGIHKRSFSTSQIDENYNQQRLPSAASLYSDSVPHLQHDEDDCLSVASQDQISAFPLGQDRSFRWLSEERPPSTLTTNSFRSTHSTKPLLGNDSRQN